MPFAPARCCFGVIVAAALVDAGDPDAATAATAATPATPRTEACTGTLLAPPSSSHRTWSTARTRAGPSGNAEQDAAHVCDAGAAAATAAHIVLGVLAFSGAFVQLSVFTYI